MFSNQVPFIFSVVFLLAFTFPIVMVAQLARKGEIKRGFATIIGFYILYLTYVALASLNGFFDDVMLPPKIVLTTTLPFAIFITIVFLSKTCKKANIILTLEELVGIHVFRLIGSTFLILLFFELLPPLFALIAGIGDVLTAVTSVWVVRAIRLEKTYARGLTYVWNTFGLVDILVTSAMAIIFTKISIDNGVQGVEFLAEFPFCFIPAFAPPTIIFLHLLVFRKLGLEK